MKRRSFFIEMQAGTALEEIIGFFEGSPMNFYVKNSTIEVRGIPEGYETGLSLWDFANDDSNPVSWMARMMLRSTIEVGSEWLKSRKTSLKITVRPHEEESCIIDAECSHHGAETILLDIEYFLRSVQEKKEWSTDALKTLRETYALGKISTEEFLRRKKVLETTGKKERLKKELESTGKKERLKKELEQKCMQCEELYVGGKISKERAIQYMEDLAKSIIKMNNQKKIDQRQFDEFRRIISSYYYRFVSD